MLLFQYHYFVSYALRETVLLQLHHMTEVVKNTETPPL